MAHQLINFDLSTEKLRKIYPNNYRKIYSEISVFMENNGFEHKQYSGYMSKKPMTYAKALAIVEKFMYEKPIFAEVAKSCIISDAKPALHEIKPYLDQLALEIKQSENKLKVKLMPRKKNSKTKTRTANKVKQKSL